MTKKTDKKKLVGVSRLIGPEDLKVGLWVTVAEQTYMGPADEQPHGGGVIDTVTWTGAHCRTGEPFEVRAVALPFVYATDADGDVTTLDLRRQRLARLPKAYGVEARRIAKERKTRS
ncbi:MAG: hypothetical protein AAGI46_10535 [Planctomycetota bacterium]